MLELGKTTKVRALGKDWVISRLELRIIEAWREYLVEQIGDPFADCDRPWFRLLNQQEQMLRIKAAENVADQLKPHKFQITCPVSQETMATPQGSSRFGRLMLEEHHPDIDDSTALQVWLEIAPQMDKIMARAQGKVPGGNGTSPAAAGDVQPVSLIGTGST